MPQRTEQGISDPMRRTVIVMIGVLLWNVAPLAHSQLVGMMGSSDRVKATAVAQRDRVLPGADVPVAVVFDHDPNWHIHTNDPQAPRDP